MSKQINKGLGRGFGSLLPTDFDQSMLLDKHDRVQKIQITEIKPDPHQPRREFDDLSIKELAESIKRYGILQPLVVTEAGNSYYIVAGERRFRAAKAAGLKTVPALVRSLEEMERLEVSLIENVQRVDLNPIEQAVSIARLHEQFNISYREIAKRLGKAHTTIVNIVRLLQLPEFARSSLIKGRISEGHARSILALKTQKLQKALLKKIEQNHWSVRRAEQYVAENKELTPKDPVKQSSGKFIKNKTLSKKLSTKWGFVIEVSRGSSTPGGRIAIKFRSAEQLEHFVDFLEKSKNN